MSDHASFHDLAGRSVFITGGGSGIGAALTEGFVAAGARVAFVDKTESRALVDRLAVDHDAPLFIEADVTDIDALKGAMDQAAAAHGPISVLVNNAANDTRHTLDDFSVAEWDASIAVNLRPHFFSAQHVAPGMRAMGGGAIINFSSVSYMMGNGGYPAYATSKAAITGLTRSLARELGPANIRVNALMPGWVLTERQLVLWANPDDLAAHLQRQCLKEHLVPSDIVDPALFLASDASRMMTGQALVIDGGVVTTG